MQMRDRVFDVIVMVLPRAAFCREYATAVNIFKVPVGEFVVSLGVLGFLVVDSQVPFAIFRKTVEANEFIFLLCGWRVLAPCIALVEYKSYRR
jgi:hypothetical protein